MLLCGRDGVSCNSCALAFSISLSSAATWRWPGNSTIFGFPALHTFSAYLSPSLPPSSKIVAVYHPMICVFELNMVKYIAATLRVLVVYESVYSAHKEGCVA